MRGKLLTMTIYTVSSLMTAIFYGVVVYFLVYRLIADGNMLITYLGNIIFIIAGLFIDDKAVQYATSKYPLLRQEARTSKRISTKIIYAFSLVSFRTALYMFSIFALIFSRVTILEPGIIPFQLERFFLSVESGIILLIAVERFRAQLLHDDGRIKKIAAKFCKKNKSETEV